MCVYTSIHTYIHAYTGIQVLLGLACNMPVEMLSTAYVCTHAYSMHVSIHTAYIEQTCMYAHAHTYKNTRTDACMHARMHAHMQVWFEFIDSIFLGCCVMHIYAHIPAYTGAFTHTHR